LYERLAPSVVTSSVKDSYGEHVGTGSGFFVDKVLIDSRFNLANFYRSWTHRERQAGTPSEYGYVLTNYHVIHPAVFADVVLLTGDKGKVYEVIAEDKQADLALISVLVKTSRPLNAVSLAGDDPRVLTTVYAIGSPKGLSGTASEGKVSGYREFPEGSRWLQTTAPISPGSSGGPLLLADGTLAGVNTLSIKDAQNLNFAVPVSRLQAFLTSEFKIRNISEGASIAWTEKHALLSMSVALQRHTEAAIAAGEKLEKARHEIDSAVLVANSGQKFEHYTEAINLAHEAEESLPQEFGYLAHYILGEAYLSRAISKLAARHADSIAQRQSRFRANSDAQNANRYLSQATASNPKFAPAFHQLRSYYAIAGDWIEALRVSDSLVTLLPRSADALQERAKCHDELGRYRSAKADLEAAIELAPRRASLHYDLGWQYSSLNEFSQAIVCYERALGLEPTLRTDMIDKFQVYFSLGNAHSKAGNFRKAIAAYETAKSLAPATTPSGVLLRSCDEQIAKCRQQLE
jgi:tetratricopeptide (TPR) repeat protein